jgi:hypothetical protein
MKLRRTMHSRLAVGACLAASVGLLGIVTGCHKAEDAINGAQADAVESALNDALATTVDPLVGFVGAIPAIASGGARARAAFGTVTCPDTSSVCSAGGSVVCTPNANGYSLDFSFASCGVVTGAQSFTLSGVLNVTPGSTIYFSFSNFSINNSLMNGSGNVNTSTCTYTVNSPGSTSVNGTIVKCDSDSYPHASPASYLNIALESAQIDVSFDGSAVAQATATHGGNTVANCSINMAAHPFTSSCSAP